MRRACSCTSRPRADADPTRALGGLILYRHGGRLSTVHSADAPGVRDTHPGVMHLLRWRAIQLAIREGRARDGPRAASTSGPITANPPGAIRWPGLYEHKRSFGASWVEMTGAHERVDPAVALRPRAGRFSRLAAHRPMTAADRPASRRRHPRPLGGLVARLAAEGRLRGARLDGRAVGAAGLGRHRGPRRHPRLACRQPGLALRGDPRAARRRARLRRGRGPSRCRRARSSSGHSRGGRAAARGRCARPALATRRGLVVRRPVARAAVVGITGTDGKTTTAYLAVAALEAAGLADRDDRHDRDADRRPDRGANEAHATTPEAPELQAALRAMVDAGDGPRSSRRRRTAWRSTASAAIAYDVAILTNLTHEHLELHGTWEAYRDAKLSLFERLRATARRSPSRTLASDRRSSTSTTRRPACSSASTQEAGARVLTYGTDAAADVRATRVDEDAARPAHRLRRRRRARRRSTCGWSAGSTSTTRSRSSRSARRSGWIRPAVREGLASVAGRARAGWSAIEAGPAVRRHRRLRPQPGVARRPSSTCSRRPRRRAAAASSPSSGRPGSATRPSGR